MKEAMDILKVLAERLGTTTEYLWRVLVVQGQLELVKAAVAIVVLIIASVALWRVGVKGLKDEFDDYDANEAAMICGFGAAAVCWVIILIAFGSIQTPEAYALSSVLEALK